MSISPFAARPARPPQDAGRNRLVVLIATFGIAATLLAYSVSPGVRHAVGHAAHSVKGAVSRIIDHDKSAKQRTARLHTRATGAGKSTSTPTRTAGGTVAP
jgi:hypothetical protein